MKKMVDEVLGAVLVLLMAVMTLDVLWGVITRYILGSQADWTEELARYLLMWIGILGAAWASGQRMHLAIDLLQEKLSDPGRQKLSIFIHSIVMVFAFLIMVVGGIRLLYISHTLGQISAGLRIPMTVIYAVLPISGILVVYYKINELVHLRSAPEITREEEK